MVEKKQKQEHGNLTTHENQKFYFKDAKDTVPVSRRYVCLGKS
jgi:hypothetical protein